MQAVSTPSVPQFTIKLVDYSYDIPPTSTTYIDQYTGKEITTTTPGRHVPDKRIEVTIKNQPFTPYTNENGDKINLYYTVQVKGHFGEDKDWSSFTDWICQSDSGYTIVTKSTSYQEGYQLDFRVKAMSGYPYVTNADSLAWIFHGQGSWAFHRYESSDWSKTQTFTMPNTSPTVSPSQTTTQPTNPSTTPDSN